MSNQSLELIAPPVRPVRPELPTTQTTKLQYVARDLLRVSSKEGIMAHQVNTVGAIGGLNKAICDKFSVNRKAIAESASNVELGSMLLVEDDSYSIANLVSQVFPGVPVADIDSYELRRKALHSALTLATGECAKRGVGLFVPYMLASGRAGDSWQVIERMLESFVSVCPITVCVPIWAEEVARSRGYLSKAESLTV